MTLLIDIFFVHFSKNVRADSTILSEEKVQAIIEDEGKNIEIASNQLFPEIFGVRVRDTHQKSTSFSRVDARVSVRESEINGSG